MPRYRFPGDVRDFGTGVILMAAGAVYGAITLQKLDIGSAREMGPGYLPGAMSIAILAIGLVLVARSLLNRQAEGVGRIAWRPMIALSAGIGFFALTAEGLGILLSVFFTCMIVTQATPRTRLVRAVSISAALALFCSTLFRYLLGLPLPLMGAWLAG